MWRPTGPTSGAIFWPEVVRRVVVRSEARAEIFEARRWYDERALGLGRTFGEVLDSVILRIASDPAQFPQVHGWWRRAVLARFPQAVYFRETSDRVVILAVHGGSTGSSPVAVSRLEQERPVAAMQSSGCSRRRPNETCRG